MILPIRTSIRPQQTPYANYTLIAVNVLIFLFEYYADRRTDGIGFRHWMLQFMLTPARPHLWQFVSYAFLHGGLAHIIGNMFFLYLFGNNVNDKLGNISYLCLYLGGAVFAGVGHTFLHISPALGASGAVAAVTGAYLVLFPQTLITVLYWFFFIGTMELSAIYFIAFKLIVWDNIVEPRFSSAAVAYDAHLAGYAFGIFAILLMLSTGLVSGNGLDLWSMIRQWNRRRRYRDVVSGSYDPFTGQKKAKRIWVKEVKTDVPTQQEEEIRRLREEIARRTVQRNLPAAAEAYLQLIKFDSEQILPRQNLLDIANQFAGQSRYAESAQAYEKFLANYAGYEYVEQVELMLGILYSRYLHQPDAAIKYLKSASGKLSEPGQLKMCQDELAKLQT